MRRGLSVSAELLGLVLLGCTVAGWFAERDWRAELFTHFRLHYLLLGVLILGMAAAAKRQRVLVLVPLLMATHLYAAWDYLGLPQKPIPGPTSGSLVCANVLTENRNTQLLLHYLSAVRPDAFVLVEVDERWLESLSALRALYPHRLEAPQSNNFGVALWSRYPLSDARVIKLAGINFPAVSATVELPDGKLRVLGLHSVPPLSAYWSGLRDSQLNYAANQVAAVDSMPGVMCGDFNLTPFAPQYQRMAGGKGLRDSAMGRGYQASWPSWLGPLGIPIDQLWSTQGLEILSREVGPQIGSDHLPIRVSFRIEKQPPS